MRGRRRVVGAAVALLAATSACGSSADRAGTVVATRRPASGRQAGTARADGAVPAAVLAAAPTAPPPAPAAVTAAVTTATAATTATAPAPAAGPATTGAVTSTTTSTTGALDPDVAALPDGHGARLAIVVDDAGGPDASLQGYLDLPIALTVSVIPWNLQPAAHAERAFAAGKEVTLHLPLANRRGDGNGRSRLSGTESPAQVEAFVADAIGRVPHAVGANNHEGPYGSAQPALMRSLLASLTRHGLFFMDSVTSQRTVGFAVEAELGLPPRVNNVFLDHFESDDDSRQALLHLAALAAANGAAIGICHVHHPYELHALQSLQAQLRAHGYVFAPLSQVTNGLTAGLDSGVRTQLPA